MTRARKELVSLADTPYYHCICRCVRRAFLWGTDHLTGRDYSHRKQWVIDRLGELSAVFAVEVCAYAVMSNHYHLVVRIDEARAQAWTEIEVLERWAKLFHLPALIEAYRKGQLGTEAEQVAARDYIAKCRQRLYDLSWYMQCLNEHLARQANAEDGCKGRFWEGRFKSQALLDEAGLLTCMAYVDLNPIRAGMADTPEASEFTSIYQRIAAVPIDSADENAKSDAADLPLAPFKTEEHPTTTEDPIPFTLANYLELVDWTGRAIRDDKRGHIPNDLPPILKRLAIDPDHWVRHMRREGLAFNIAVGRLQKLNALANSLGRRWICGRAASARLFGASPG